MIKKFHFIELLRFITSFAVIIRHYHFFFSPRYTYSTIQIINDPSLQPFYFFLKTFYLKGDYAVPVFWGISGFIFALVYLEQRKNVTGKEFFFNRFSRLYPLHFLTLLLVTFAQIINYYLLGSHQILGNNDIYRFVLHLFFISGWEGESFNLPIWSVSVEILIYLFFFLSIMFLNKLKVKYVLLIYFISLVIDKFVISSIFIDCFRLFFTGVLVYYVNYYIRKKIILIPLSLILIVSSFIGNFKIFLFTPGILFLFISMEYFVKSEKKKIFDFFGNLTYSMYLLHIPTMLIIIIIFYNYNLSDEIFLNNFFFIFYIFLILSLSYLSFQFFEKPLNKNLREKFLNS